jgi:hypothetical protein
MPPTRFRMPTTNRMGSLNVSAVRRGLALLLLPVIASACHRAGGIESGASAIQIDSREMYWRRVYIDIFDSIAVSAGLQPLHAVSLPAGQREIRLWIGVAIGYPQDLYRFVENRGRVTGELVRHWPDNTFGSSDSLPRRSFHDLMVYSERGRCVDFRLAAGMGTCRGSFVRQPDWKKALRRAEAFDLWTLPDESSLPPDGMRIFDGWNLVVELRDGPGYRSYYYGNPDAHKAWPQAAKAVAIARAMAPIGELLRPSGAMRPYRGITTGRYQSEFVDCATGERWEFHEELKSLAERSKVAFVPASDTTARYVVQVVAELSPDWLAREWESEYSRVLQVMRLVSVRSEQGTGCADRRQVGGVDELEGAPRRASAKHSPRPRSRALTGGAGAWHVCEVRRPTLPPRRPPQRRQSDRRSGPLERAPMP